MAVPRRQDENTYTELGIPSLGMDTDTVPRLLPPTKAPLLKNFLMDRPGLLPTRGPICEGVSWNPGASLGVCGIWTYDDKLLLSQFTPNGGGSNFDRDYWVAPYRKASVFNDLRELSLQPQLIDLAAGTTTTLAATTATPGLKSVRVGNFVYGPGAWDAAAATVTQDGYVYFSSKIIKWDGTSGGLVEYTHGPKIAQDIAYHYNRLFVLGGIPEGASTIQFNTLTWTDQLPTDGTAMPDTAANWQDDVSGLVNQLVIGGEDANDFGVALGHVGQNLAILKRRSLWMLYGTAPSNWTVKKVADLGCIDPRSVVQYEHSVCFMSDRGFVSFDGTVIRNLSDGLRSTLVANALKQVGQVGVDGGYVRATQLAAEYIMVTTGSVHPNTLTATGDTDAWLLHVPSGAWSQLSSGALATIIAGGRTTNHTYLLSDTKLVKANYLFSPAAAPTGTRGFDSIDSGATKFVIPSRWTTRALALGSPPRKSKLQRIVADYYWSLSNGGWQVTTNTRGETGVVNTVGTLAAPAGISGSLPARGAIDIFNETDELYLDIAATSGAPAPFDGAELHRVIVESRPSHEIKASL